jgi:hypothetical protein
MHPILPAADHVAQARGEEPDVALG